MKNSMNVTTPSDHDILVTRAFNAPRHLVYEAMSDPEKVRRWMFAPPGWTMEICEDDARVGGTFHWAWSNAEGPAMSMRGVYREVVPLERIVRTEVFEFGCNAQAGQQLVTLTLTEQGGQTLLTLNIHYDSKEARDGALASGMEGGMSVSYDQLEAMLAR